jgi:DNA replication and repair protein RecF
MYLKKISLLNFKSYQQLDLDLHSKINCFVGNNGQGKTNLLDAVYYLSMCKSSLNPTDYQNIRHTEDFFVVQGIYDRLGEEDNIYCAVQRNSSKVFKRNGKEYQRLADHIGHIPIVIISPTDTSLIAEGSEERRKFLNTVISQYDKVYLDKLMRYNKLLANRNKLLKDMREGGNYSYDLLEVIDDQLSTLALSIFEKRKEFANHLTPFFQEYYTTVSGDAEKVEIEYQSHLQNGNLKDLLASSLDKDRILQYTTKGIHKDEIAFKYNDQPLKREGSQGQQKTFLIALKLAQFRYMCDMLPVKPILLLDDIFDKLDPFRVQQFIRLVAHNGFGQIFITDANKSRLDNIMERIGGGFNLFNVDNGEVQIIRNA